MIGLNWADLIRSALKHVAVRLFAVKPTAVIVVNPPTTDPELQRMSNPAPPPIKLGNPPKNPYADPRRIKARPALDDQTGPFQNKKSFVQKSDLKPAKNQPSSHTAPQRTVVRMYGNKNRTWKQISSDPSDEDTSEDPVSTSTPKSSGSESAFKMPPDLGIDLALLKELPHNKRGSADRSRLDGIPAAKRPRSFKDPNDIKGSPKGSSSQESISPVRVESSFILPPHVDIPSPPNKRVCKYCNQRLPSTFTESPPTAPRARYGYCQRHIDATVVQEGKAKGFPERVDFSALRSRVKKLLPTIRKMVNSPDESEFLTNLRSKTFRKTAAAPMSMINSFEDSRPGYYGSQGAEIITGLVLRKLGDEIRQNAMLYDALKFCGGVTGYVSSVVVPEVGLRLIMEDMTISKSEARQIMKDSIAYGGVVSAKVDSDDDSE